MSRIKIVKPSLTFDEISPRLEKIINSGIYSNGTNITEFSSEISKLTKAKYCFPTSSATTALWTCLKILKIKKIRPFGLIFVGVFLNIIIMILY